MTGIIDYCSFTPSVPVTSLTKRAPLEVSWNDAKAIVAKCRSMGFQPVWIGMEGQIE
jgi:hypothetical protein